MGLLEWDILGYNASTVKEDLSFVLGLASVLCWSFAEIPQVKTNYNTKSASSLHFLFMTSWLMGDILNLLGCFLEPATLPTQLYVAMVYTIGTLTLTGQKVYYDYLCPRWGSDEEETSLKHSGTDIEEKLIKGKYHHDGIDEKLHQPSVPILVNSPSLYYMSARSFSLSPTPISGSLSSHSRDLGQIPERITSQNPSKEPLFNGHASSPSAAYIKTKDLLCVTSSSVFFLGSVGLYLTNGTSTQSHGVVMLVGRKLLQDKYNESSLEPDGSNHSMGNYLGWAMAAVYISGRLPQICLNSKSENDKGLNPYMFVLALSGNATYIASILVSSLEWSRIGPNLPWLVDAGLCVLLDICILIQLYVLPEIKGRRK